MRHRIDTVADEVLVDHGIGPEKEEGRVQHRYVDPLPGAGLFPGVQGRTDRLSRGHRGDLVAYERVDQQWLLRGRVRLQRCNAGDSLDHRIVDAPPGVGPGRADAVDGREDHPRIQLTERLVGEVHAFHDARPEVLHQDIRRGDEAMQQGLARILREIDDNGALVAVQRGELGVQSVSRNPHGAALHVAAGGLDLDDIRALVAENRCGHRSRIHVRHIDDAYSRQ